MSVECTIGKDGKKYYFKDGVRVAADKIKAAKRCAKKPSSKSVAKKTTMVAKRAGNTTSKRAPKKVSPKEYKRVEVFKEAKPVVAPAKKRDRPSGKLWLVKEVPVYLRDDGEFVTEIPLFRKYEEIGQYPVKIVIEVEKFQLDKDLVKDIHRDDDYWAITSEDLSKIESMEDPRKINLENKLNHIWEFGDLKVSGVVIPTFRKHVRSYLGPRGPKKEVRDSLPPLAEGRNYVWVDQKVHTMMREIEKARPNWTAKEWNAFLENILVNGYILSKMHPIV